MVQPNNSISFISGFNAGDVVKSGQILPSDGAVYGGYYHNYVLPVGDKPDEDIFSLMKYCMEREHIKRADGVNLFVVTLQLATKGFGTYFILVELTKADNEKITLGFFVRNYTTEVINVLNAVMLNR